MKNNLLTWELLPMTLASKSWQGHLTSSRDGSTKLRLGVGSLLVRWRGQTEEGIQGSGRWGRKYEFILWDWRTHHLCFLEGHGEESSLHQDHKEWTAKEGRGVFGYTFVPFRSLFPASKTNLLLPSLMQHQLHTGSDQLCTGVTWHPPSMGLWLTGPGPLSQSSGCRILGTHTCAAW